MSNRLCFVWMPSGKKPGTAGRMIDFDAVYREIVVPALEQTELEPVRADGETADEIIDELMFDRLLLCAYAVLDLTIASPNMFYELGVRHALHPWRTVPLFAGAGRPPFDEDRLRAIRYELAPDGTPRDAAGDRLKIAVRLEAARGETSHQGGKLALFQLLDDLPPAEVSHEKTDVFRDRVRYSEPAKAALETARKADSADEIDEVLRRLRPRRELAAAVSVDAMLSYRAVKAWDRMIAFIEQMPKELRSTLMVQEQLGFALNRAGRSDEAERVLSQLIAERGPSPETLAILGRVHKDRWEATTGSDDDQEASTHLDHAIDTYVRGFEADVRDAYPGVNALMLLEVRDPSDPRIPDLAPVVRSAMKRKLSSRKPDYWDYATLLELAILQRDPDDARTALARALAAVRESWEPETTAKNLSFIRDARANRGEVLDWANDAEEKLREKAGLTPTLE